MKKIWKEDKVLCIAWILALVSMCLIPPDQEYWNYIDVRVLALLFCLMVIVKGFQKMGVFDLMIHGLFQKVKTSTQLYMVLVMVCFFMSMLITNDVALITFVPFAILALETCHKREQMIPVVVLQTIAANLGSMFTPIGNPQNLYLFSISEMGLREFFKTMAPFTGISFLLLVVALMLLKKEPIDIMPGHQDSAEIRGKDVAPFALLFVVALLVVFRVIPWPVALIITTIAMIAMKKTIMLKEVDYGLLFTFVGFFIFVGNVGRIPMVNELIRHVLQGREIGVSVMCSQFLSNVPAAILLSGFTERISELLIGTNLGGLGTMIASMASLISYKLYCQLPDSDSGKYMRMFTIYNVVGLVVLLVMVALIYR